MTKAEVAEAIANLEAFISRLDTAVLIFAALVAIGVVGEAILGVWHWRLDGQMRDLRRAQDQLHETELAQFHLDSEEAKAQAAQAEQRAAEASLELAKLKAPRTLRPEQQNRIIAKLNPFGGTKFDIGLMPSDPEAEMLLTVVESMLSTARWEQIDWNGGTIIYTRTGKPVVGQTSLYGVVIQLRPEEVSQFWPAALALAPALHDEGIAAEAQPGLGIVNNNMDAIHILVGKKP